MQICVLLPSFHPRGKQTPFFDQFRNEPLGDRLCPTTSVLSPFPLGAARQPIAPPIDIEITNDIGKRSHAAGSRTQAD